jgi:hypothetical protein
MKKFILFLIVFLVSFNVMAQGGVDPVAVPPEWVANVLVWVKTLPYVGPVVVEILKWVGLVAGVMTALSVMAQALLAIPEIAARFAGAPGLAEKIKYWSDKILYWLKYFSVFNAKK